MVNINITLLGSSLPLSLKRYYTNQGFDFLVLDRQGVIFSYWVVQRDMVRPNHSTELPSGWFIPKPIHRRKRQVTKIKEKNIQKNDSII